MDSFVNGAKGIVKFLVPDRILHPLWARYLSATSKEDPASSAGADRSSHPDNEPNVPRSLIGDPDVLATIRSKPPATNSEPDFLTMDWLTRRTAEVQGTTVAAFFAITDGDNFPSLCAPEHSHRALIDAVIAVSVESDLRLDFMMNGRRISRSNHAQLIEDLLAKPSTKIRLVSPDGELVLFLERWRIDDRTLVAPRPNPITLKMYFETSSAKHFLERPGRNLRELYPLPMAEQCTFDVDVVYTWVDSEDPGWQDMLRTVISAEQGAEHTASGAPLNIDQDRFANRDELKFSLRSLLKFAPWVRNIYVVSNCQPPDWLDLANERVRWVPHEDILDKKHLPTFNSHAIEASIHLIPDLSEQFLYFNDDLFLMRPAEKSDFFLPNGISKIRPEPYGIVHGDLDERDPDYVNAARNGQALLQAEFGKTATRLHTHSPQSVRLSVIRSCDATFRAAYDATRSNRFRTIDDISPTSFLYPNFAYLSGNAVMDFSTTALINYASPYEETLDAYRVLVQNEQFEELPLTACINDGGGSAEDEAWGRAVSHFMQTTFGEQSEAERQN